MVKDLCFEVIERCLNNCEFCSSNSNCNKTQIIEFDVFKRVIDYFISTGGIGELSISGGEPFLHPDIFKMIEYSKSLGIRTVVFTSGVIEKKIPEDYRSLLNEQLQERLREIDKYEPDNKFLRNIVISTYRSYLSGKYDSLSKDTLMYLKRIGFDKIVFDYQGYEDETDHMLMGRGEESRVALLGSLKNAASVGLDVDVHFVPMKPNYKEIGDILEMLKIAGVKKISLLNFIPQGRGKKNKDKLQLSQEELDEFLLLVDKYEKTFPGHIRKGILLQGENEHKCNAGLEKLDIKFDGTVLPCPAFKELSEDECRRFNIKLPNIYTDLEEIKISGKGTRAKPLCKQIYYNIKNST